MSLSREIQDAIDTSMGEGVTVVLDWTLDLEREIGGIARHFLREGNTVTASADVDDQGAPAPWIIELVKS